MKLLVHLKGQFSNPVYQGLIAELHRSLVQSDDLS